MPIKSGFDQRLNRGARNLLRELFQISVQYFELRITDPGAICGC